MFTQLQSLNGKSFIEWSIKMSVRTLTLARKKGLWDEVLDCCLELGWKDVYDGQDVVVN